MALPQSARVRATVHDLQGREVRVIAEQRYAAGEHVLAWDGRTERETLAPSGVYFVRVQRDGQDTRSIKLLKLQ
jgi:flagellar hook assembly protein FlgD